ncbi:MAG: hypothetical protein OEV93_03125 [Candidatus Moranbacteria bacterium]|nr:hypothetical protein [Candidatus Moranbacteria bacterium]
MKKFIGIILLIIVAGLIYRYFFFLRGYFSDAFFMVAGGFFAVVITDWMKKPKLVIKFSGGGHNNSHRYLNAKVYNKPLNFLWVFKIQREAMLDCVADLSTDYIDLVDNHGKTGCLNLRWESDRDHTKLEKQKTLYSGKYYNLRIIGKINGDEKYFGYIYDYFSEARLFWSDKEKMFILKIEDTKGNKFEKKFWVINKGAGLNDIEIKTQREMLIRKLKSLLSFRKV